MYLFTPFHTCLELAVAGAPFGAKYWGVSKISFDKEVLNGLKSVIFPACDEYWGGLSPPFWRILSFLPPNFGGA